MRVDEKSVVGWVERRSAAEGPPDDRPTTFSYNL
jgi:hypothetical protein